MKKISINDQDRQVAEFLKAAKIQFFVSYATPFGDNVMDSWKVKISMRKTDQAGNSYAEFDYYTGIGHRIEAPANSNKLSASQITSAKELQALLGKDRLDQTVIKIGGDWSKTYAVCPTQASVLYSLLLDAQCADQNFDDFCSDLGYNPDSRKDFKVYESCCEILQKMRKIFTNTERAELSEILQDY